MSDKPIILITGASRGLGAAMSANFSGWANVYGGSRSGRVEPGIRSVKLDVTNNQSVQQAIEHVLNDAGRIDVLINNAGIVLSGASEYLTDASVAHQMDVNFLGAVRTTKAVLPIFRRQCSGRIINISSMGAVVPLPFRAYYSASKAALEAWAWGLRLEVRQFGIGVSCIQVGDCVTELSEHESGEFQDLAANEYSSIQNAAISRYRQDEDHGLPPVKFAKQIARIVRRQPSQLRFRYTAGVRSQRFLFVCRHLLSDSMLERFVRNMYLRSVR